MEKHFQKSRNIELLVRFDHKLHCKCIITIEITTSSGNCNIVIMNNTGVTNFQWSTNFILMMVWHQTSTTMSKWIFLIGKASCNWWTPNSSCYLYLNVYYKGMLWVVHSIERLQTKIFQRFFTENHWKIQARFGFRFIWCHIYFSLSTALFLTNNILKATNYNNYIVKRLWKHCQSARAKVAFNNNDPYKAIVAMIWIVHNFMNVKGFHCWKTVLQSPIT